MFGSKIIAIVFFVCAQAFISLGFANEQLVNVENFGNNPGNLKLFVYNPALNDTSKHPIVVVLHGCEQTAGGVAELTGWNKLAALQHFIILYPQQKIINNPSMCFNWFNKHDIEKGRGECESIYEMIEYAKQQLHGDAERIYITGLSAGAAMSVVMAAVHPEVFKGAAIFAGGAYKGALDPFSGIRLMAGKKDIPQYKLVNYVLHENRDYKGKYPTIIVYQGLNDNVVNYKNANLIIRQWAGVLQTDTIPDKTETSFMGISDIVRTEYNTSSITVIICYLVNNLGHQLLIKPGSKNNEGGHLGLFGVDKGFHSTYQTAIDFGLILPN